jgi:hypothetical protein
VDDDIGPSSSSQFIKLTSSNKGYANFSSSKTRLISSSLSKSSLTIDGGFARVKPVPTTFQCANSNDLATSRPSRPLAVEH